MNPMQNRLRRWDFLTLDSFFYGLGSKCLDLLSRYDTPFFIKEDKVDQYFHMCFLK